MVRTRALGNRTRYAPRTPATAPLAPIIGIPMSSGQITSVTTACPIAAITPHTT